MREETESELERVAAHYDHIARLYDGAFLDPVDIAEDQAASALLSEAGILRGHRVIDVGCGTGKYLELRPDTQTDRYLGFDISHGMTDEAKRKFPGFDFRVADLRNIPFPTKSFDAGVCLFGAMNYIKHWDQERAIIELGKMLFPGSPFLIIFFSPRYHHREHHIADGLNLYVTSAERVRFLAGRICRHPKIRGFSCLPDLVGRRLPGWATRAWFKTLDPIVGRIKKNAGYFITAWGVRDV